MNPKVRNVSEPGVQLPRLTYIGDVPVESSSHGSALIFRVLQGYPPERLQVLESGFNESLPDRRLSGVAYQRVLPGWSRPLNSRFNRLWATWLSGKMGFKVRAIEERLGDFNPEAVLTVHHGYSWLAAAALARRRELPLHLVLHDDWNRMAPFVESLRPWLDRKFRNAYQQATSRFCVSPYMEEVYRERHGVAGTVLYPSHARDCVQFAEPPERLGVPPRKFTVAFCGNIFTTGYWNALRRVVEILARMGGRLILFSPHTREQAAANGLSGEALECRGFVKSEELIKQLRHEADALFIPMSFDAVDRANMEISFPSKLTDSTLPGVPLLIYGPHYCSAVRWARENAGVAEVVANDDEAELANAVDRLRRPEHRTALGKHALATGNKCFAHPVAERIFFANLAVRAGN